MATVAENAATAYANWTAALAVASANPQPNYTLPGGISVDYVGYMRFLTEAQESARKAMLATAGPFTVTSVAR